MFLINLYYKMDRNKIRSVLMTPSTHSTQQTFAQSYKKKWVANEDFIECKLIFIRTRVHYYKNFWPHGPTVGSLPHTGHPLRNLGRAAVPGHVCHLLLQVVRRIIVVVILAAVVILVVLAAAVLLLAVAEARGVATVVARRGDVGWGEDIADLVLGSPVAGVSSS